MNITIIGLGLIGGSIALDLKKRGFANKITGVDTDRQNAENALKLGIADDIRDIETAASEADIIVISIPVNGIIEVLPGVMNKIKKHTAVTDVGSTKKDICRLADRLAGRQQYVASHPMAGTENSGPASALKDLFNDKTCIICEKEKSNPESLKLIEKMYKTLGMRIVYMDSETHDLHTAFVSHLSHITSFALANTVLDKEKRHKSTIFNLAGGGFESTARLAKSSPEMWGPIFSQNKENISDALEMYIEHIKLFKKYIDENNISECKKLMHKANSIRQILTSIIKNNS